MRRTIDLEGNYNNTLGRFPYDAATQSWEGLSTISAADGNASTDICPEGSGTPAAPYEFACGDTPNASPYFFQPWAIAIDPNNNVSAHVGPATGTVLSFQGGTAAACTVAQGCTGPGTVMMTINTNIPSGVASLDKGASGTVFAAMFGLGLLSFVFGRRRSLRTRALTLTCLMVCCGITAGINGCTTQQLGGSTGTPRPTGTYTVLVTAKQVGSQAITATPGITYGNGNQMSLPFTISVAIH
jgi:hypothetical protein